MQQLRHGGMCGGIFFLLRNFLENFLYVPGLGVYVRLRVRAHTSIDGNFKTLVVNGSLRGRGLVMMKQAETNANSGEEFRTGLVPSEAEVTFNSQASGSQDGKLYVVSSPVSTSAIPTGGTGGANLSTSYSASRGNQIVIRFRSLGFDKKTTKTDGSVILEGVTDPKVLDELIKILNKKEIDMKMYETIGPDGRYPLIK
jgi:hypothetical protein